MTPEETLAFLKRPNIAHFITLRNDGSPHSVPVWYEYADQRFCVFTPVGSVKLKNLLVDSRMTLSIASEDKPYRYVIAEGQASVTFDNPFGRAASIASRYEGTDGGPRYIESLEFEIAIVTLEPSRMKAWVSQR